MSFNKFKSTSIYGNFTNNDLYDVSGINLIQSANGYFQNNLNIGGNISLSGLINGYNINTLSGNIYNLQNQITNNTTYSTGLSGVIYNNNNNLQNQINNNYLYSIGLSGTINTNNNNLQNQISNIIHKSTVSNFIKYMDNMDGLCFSITTDPYFSDSLSFTSPISSNEVGYTTTIPITITNTISGISCIVKKNGVPFATPTVFINSTFPISYTVTLNGSNGAQNYQYGYNEYFCNANINFLPAYENATNIYTVYLGINGSGNFYYNSTIQPHLIYK